MTKYCERLLHDSDNDNELSGILIEVTVNSETNEGREFQEICYWCLKCVKDIIEAE